MKFEISAENSSEIGFEEFIKSEAYITRKKRELPVALAMLISW
jgi:hypothetical protein